jgi:hypothetical protein
MPLLKRSSLFNTLAIGMMPACSLVAGDGPPRIKSDSSGRSHPTGFEVHPNSHAARRHL